MPAGMRPRPRGNKIFYYLDTGGKPRKEIPLGSDYVLAVAKWAELACSKVPADGTITFTYVIERYFAEVVPAKAPGSQRGDLQEKAWALRFFGDPPAPMTSVEPQHIRQFMRWRAAEARARAVAKNEARKSKGGADKPVPKEFGQVRANRAKALVSHMWNWARGEGLTKVPNPCAGIHRFKESGRATAPDVAMVAKVVAEADAPLQFALRLADLIGQRPSDVRKLKETDISGGYLHIKQGKTAAKLRMNVMGDLAALIAEIQEYKAHVKAKCTDLLVNEDGKPLMADAMRYRFDKARDAAGIPKNEFQFRDLRAKVATEADDEAGTKVAQAILGHTTEAMTAEYIRHKSGRRVKPLR